MEIHFRRGAEIEMKKFIASEIKKLADNYHISRFDRYLKKIHKEIENQAKLGGYFHQWYFYQAPPEVTNKLIDTLKEEGFTISRYDSFMHIYWKQDGQ